MSKEDLKLALFELPVGLGEHIDKTIPSLEDISTPTTVDEAIIAQGVLAKNINDILKEFEQLKLLRIFLHIGQHNTALQALAALSMQMFTPPGGFTIVSPDGLAPGGLVDITFSLTTDNYENVEDARVIAVEESTPENSIEILLAQDATDPTLFTEAFALSDGYYTLKYKLTIMAGEQYIKTRDLQVGGG